MDMAEVPDLLKNGSILTTAKERDTSCLRLDGGLQLRQSIGRLIRRDDASGRKDLESRILLEGADDGIKKVDDVLVFLIFGSIACDVEGGGACCMFGEFVCPEISIRRTLTDPVLAHVVEEIKPSKLKNELVDTGACIRWNGRSIGQNTWRRISVKLARQVAV